MSLINIGIMRKSAEIKNYFYSSVGEYRRTLFQLGTHYGLRLVVFSAKDINLDANKVYGRYIENGKVEQCSIEIPYIIENRILPSVPFAELTERGVHLIRRPTGFTKNDHYNTLRKDGKYSDLLIPTKPIKKFEEIVTEIDNYSNIIVKPDKGMSGKGVRHLSRSEDKYCVTYAQKKFYFTQKELCDNWYKKWIEGKDFIVQPYLPSITKYGEPFDIRLGFIRGSAGKFVAAPFIRVGNSKGIVSNISSGGYRFPLDLFLHTNYENENVRNCIQDKIKILSKEFPDYYNSFFKDEIFDISLDIGVTLEDDNNVKLRIFEVNILGLVVELMEKATVHCQYLRCLAEKQGLI